ncbi:MAG: hypothetical protein EON59_01075 [Alphaproteobacteria bacterium]|nr:MAG: hypothetical protein EON59_01075 [Alphaproteobacteria bacterium]
MDEPAPEARQEAPIAPAAGRGPANRLVDQLKDRSGQLADLGLAKAAELAETKKEGAVEKLDAATGIVRDLADAAGERFGAPVGDVVHRGGNALEAISQKLQDQSVEDIVGAGRSAIVRYPAIALAAVSVAGFLAGRIVKGGLSQSANRRSYGVRISAVEAAA